MASGYPRSGVVTAYCMRGLWAVPRPHTPWGLANARCPGRGWHASPAKRQALGKVIGHGACGANGGGSSAVVVGHALKAQQPDIGVEQGIHGTRVAVARLAYRADGRHPLRRWRHRKVPRPAGV